VANLASAKKRNKQNERNRTLNRVRKSVLKTETRKFLDALQRGDLEQAKELHKLVTRKIDQVASKGTLHKNTASRRKATLARRLNAAVSAKAT